MYVGGFRWVGGKVVDCPRGVQRKRIGEPSSRERRGTVAGYVAITASHSGTGAGGELGKSGPHRRDKGQQ